MIRAELSRTTTGHQRRGFVLIIVMVIVMMVSFAGFAFVNTMSDEYRAVHTQGDLLAAEQAIASAEVLLLHVLEQQEAGSRESDTITPRESTPLETGGVMVSERNGLVDHPALFQEQLLLASSPEEDVQEDPLAWRFSIVSPNRSLDPSAEPLDEFTRVRFGLENESARLNLATLIELDAVSPEQSREVLMAFPGMTEATADSLLDWLDADNEPREFGAEAEDYLDSPSPYQPRNGLPSTLEELLLVRGVRRAALFGPDANRNFMIEPHEALSREQQGTERFESFSGAEADPQLQNLGWADLLTLHSAERNVNAEGKPRINLNQPSESQLREQLGEMFSSELVEFIAAYRQFGPVEGVASETSTAASGGTSTPASSAASVPFPISSVADLIDASVNIPDGSNSTVMQSPVTTSSPELLNELLDRTTADDRTVIPGRININIAPRPVLLAIPGMQNEAIEQIIARRSALEDQALQSPAWLLTEQLLTLDQFREVLPYITTGGDVFRAQLVAWRPAGGPYRRVEVVIDRTQRPAQRVVWNDLSAYGEALSTSTLGRGNGLEPQLLRGRP